LAIGESRRDEDEDDGDDDGDGEGDGDASSTSFFGGPGGGSRLGRENPEPCGSAAPLSSDTCGGGNEGRGLGELDLSPIDIAVPLVGGCGGRRG